MYYEINVSKNGKHHFATHERSLTSELKAREMFEEFKKKFPAKDGYDLELSGRETTGIIIDHCRRTSRQHK